MTSIPQSGHTSRGARTVAERRLRDALQHCPLSLMYSGDLQHEGEVRKPPEDLIVLTMVEALGLVGTERVVEMGARTAYLAGLLSHLAAEVYSVVAEPDLVQARERDLEALGCRNVHVVHADPYAAWPQAAPYQAMVVAAGVPQLPLEFVHQLDIGGRLIIPVGNADAQLLELFHKHQGGLDSETLCACHLSMLREAGHPPSILPWSHPSTD